MSQVSGQNVFRRDEKVNKQRDMLRKHKAWLELIQHEYPIPYKHYRIGVYIRYFNQTKYENYLDYHKQQFIDTVALCPNWELVDFYADEGISGTSTAHRDAFNQMIADAKAGKIDLIITKNVSRFARNVGDFVTIVRMLAEHNPRIGVFFESENIFF